MKKLMISALALTLLSGAAYAATVTQSAPNTFQSGEAAVATQVNDNFAAVYNNSYQNAQVLGLTQTNAQVATVNADHTNTLAIALKNVTATQPTATNPGTVFLTPGEYYLGGNFDLPANIQLVNSSTSPVILVGRLTVNAGDLLKGVTIRNNSTSPAVTLAGTATLEQVTINSQSAPALKINNTNDTGLVNIQSSTINAPKALETQNSSLTVLISNSNLNTGDNAGVHVTNSYQYDASNDQFKVLANQ